MLDRPADRPRAPPKPGRKATLQRARAARYRSRAKGGQLVVAVTVDWWVVDWLSSQGFLEPWSDGDRAQIRQALESALVALSRYEP